MVVHIMNNKIAWFSIILLVDSYDWLIQTGKYIIFASSNQFIGMVFNNILCVILIDVNCQNNQKYATNWFWLHFTQFILREYKDFMHELWNITGLVTVTLYLLFALKQIKYIPRFLRPIQSLHIPVMNMNKTLSTLVPLLNI